MNPFPVPTNGIKLIYIDRLVNNYYSYMRKNINKI